MNVLLVDDDYFVVAALEQKIDWSALSIDQVYTAYNIAQAREILLQQDIEIMVCDIEMPQGSGLELLAWIREENYAVQTIFLTNYADFNYAQKAIELQSFDYFLKPIAFDKLTLILSKAIYKVREQRRNESAIREGQLWQKNQRKMVEHFWRQLSTEKKNAPSSAALAEAIKEQSLPYQLSDPFLPLLISIYAYDQSLGIEDKDLFNYALHNVITELFHHPSFTVEAMIEVKDNHYFVILRWSSDEEAALIETACASFIQKANRFLKSDASCCIGVTAPLPELYQGIQNLLRMNENIIKHRNQMLYLEQYPQAEGVKAAVYTAPDLTRLEEWLHKDDPVSFLNEAKRCLYDLIANGQGQVLTASVLRLFRLDMIQLVYSYLKSREIQAHKLYTGKTHDQLYAASLYSVEDMEKYIEYLVTTAAEYRRYAAQQDSVVEEIKQHIHKHCGDELTRNSLGEMVYLNPDYLARIFKKETGISLGAYIIQTRIRSARQLLESTSLSVYSIAGKVGYANYPYFSKLFKQDVGCTPSEYRKLRQEVATSM
ncbi:two component AraC family transcriptional regulator [Paenibacillus sp. TCA20]|uniref:Response regulator n=1 Tax=Paenibacillus urinalis TaxID=521520 RepID=A0AAX3N0N6_9BACL|nr:MULTISPECIES: response regulator [Paenibacillus]WDH83142.1 response regulator [Paenibacillus urinalis]GAK40418.1 two component AraC family transcriptional regulator [Paenibacillus sp. TCA20]